MARKPKNEIICWPLRKAAREYLKYNDGKKIELVQIVQDRDGYEMLLARFDTLDNRRMSCLLDFEKMAGGDYMVTEQDAVCRAAEGHMLDEFLSGDDYGDFYMDEESGDDPDDDFMNFTEGFSEVIDRKYGEPEPEKELPDGDDWYDQTEDDEEFPERGDRLDYEQLDDIWAAEQAYN